jgi:hypothetical protein
VDKKTGNKEKEEWTQKLSYLVGNYLPQRVSRAQIPDDLRHSIKKIESVTQLAEVLRRKRQSVYTQSKRLLADIRSIYKIPDTGRLVNELEYGTPADFIAAYSKTHEEFAEEPETEVAAAEQSRRTDILLKKGAERQEPSKIPGLASILGIPAQYGKGRADFGFELCCGTPALIANYRAAIKRGYIQVSCGNAALSRESRKGFPQPYEVRTEHGCWHIGWDAATLQAPRWWVEAEGRASIGNFEVSPDFATLEGLSPGATVRFSFCVWRKDYDLQAPEASPPPDNEEIAVVDKGGNEIALSGEELSLVKQRIIAVIGKEALPDDGSGLVVLATHEIEFVEGGR